MLVELKSVYPIQSKLTDPKKDTIIVCVVPYIELDPEHPAFVLKVKKSKK